MKKWTNEEVAALSASVAENGYSKGIREFINSTDNVNGRTFAGCEYMINKQSHRNRADDLGDAVVSVHEPVQPVAVKSQPTEKKDSVLAKIVKWLFGVR